MFKIADKFVITDDKFHYTCGYYTTNKWIGNDKLVIVRSTEQSIGNGNPKKGDTVELVLYTISTGKIKVLTNDMKSFEDYVVYGNYVYYSNGKQIIRLNVDNLEKEIIFECDIDLWSPHITYDGKFISTYALDGEKTRIYRINTETKTGELVYKKSFAPPFWESDHAMPNPKDPNIIFYAHEGTTFYISNRLWLHDVEKNTDRNIAKQKLNEKGELGDCFGHEMWAPDGKGLYFVKYDCSPEHPNGICYVDAESGEHKLLFIGHKFWHVGVSQDGKYLLSDTQSDIFKSEVYVIDVNTGEELLAGVADTDWVHPCHPHPQMSPDDKRVIYTSLNEKGRTVVNIVNLTN